jgi:hypothetical protein
VSLNLIVSERDSQQLAAIESILHWAKMQEMMSDAEIATEAERVIKSIIHKVQPPQNQNNGFGLSVHNAASSDLIIPKSCKPFYKQ